jgi:O-methyltransferase/methyltransferase family protein
MPTLQTRPEPTTETHTVPPAVQMVQLLAGFQLSQALYAAARLGVADRLRGAPQDATALAAEVGADAQALRRVMRALASIGVFTESEDGLFGLTPLGDTLTEDSPASMRDLAIMWMETHYGPFGGLLGTVRTGRCAATEFYGQPFFTWLAEHPEHIARFSSAMANLTDGIKIGAISCCDFTDAGRIVDVGGADGAVLAHILTTAPQATGVVFDLPHVVAEARPRLAGYGLGDRLTLAAGDFFTAVPEGADTYLLSMILHDWSDPEAHRLLATIKAAAPAGARLLAFELVSPDGAEPHLAKMVDLTMLGMLTGRERTQAEYRLLLEDAGFKFEAVTATPTPISIVKATA